LAAITTGGTPRQFPAASVLRFRMIHFIPAVYAAILAAGEDRAEEWKQEECHDSDEQNHILRKNNDAHK
jgi:hypothetical protein